MIVTWWADYARIFQLKTKQKFRTMNHDLHWKFKFLETLAKISNGCERVTIPSHVLKRISEEIENEWKKHRQWNLGRSSRNQAIQKRGNRPENPFFAESSDASRNSTTAETVAKGVCRLDGRWRPDGSGLGARPEKPSRPSGGIVTDCRATSWNICSDWNNDRRLNRDGRD